MARTFLFSALVAAVGWHGMVLAELPGEDEATAVQTKPQSIDQIRLLIVDLGSSEHARREAATESLQQVGRAAIDLLVDAAIHRDLEVTARAVVILEAYYQSADEALATAADVALERLRQSKNRSAAYRANEVFKRNSDIRQQRAEKKIRELGGLFLDVNGEAIFSDVIMAHGGLPAGARIGVDWKGGDDGLRYLERLPWLRYVTIIDGSNGITDDGVDVLMQRCPDLQVQRRGPALLGVRHDYTSGLRECTVDKVQPDSAAEAAGIQEGDTITHFDGKPVADFAALVELIKKHQPGDKIEVVVRRLTESVRLKVVLGGWNAILNAKSSKK